MCLLYSQHPTQDTKTVQMNKIKTPNKKNNTEKGKIKTTGTKVLNPEITHINLYKNVTKECRICFKEVNGFLKISRSFRTW